MGAAIPPLPYEADAIAPRPEPCLVGTIASKLIIARAGPVLRIVLPSDLRVRPTGIITTEQAISRSLIVKSADRLRVSGKSLSIEPKRYESEIEKDRSIIDQGRPDNNPFRSLIIARIIRHHPPYPYDLPTGALTFCEQSVGGLAISADPLVTMCGEAVSRRAWE